MHKLYTTYLFLLISSALFGAGYSQKILITEFMAINSGNIADEDGEHSDWVEIYNNTDATINLENWYLTDDNTQLTKWKFPTATLAKGEYMIVFASGKDRSVAGSNLHTNFKLSGSGEYLAICEPDTTVSFAYAPTFPVQRQDISYGWYQGQEVFFSTATPGLENIAGSVPFAPAFSSARGFYSQPIDVTLTVPGSNDNIYYTTNGTRPTSTTGTLYTVPVSVSTTTALSAVTVNSAGISSEIITHTYIFPDDVVNQPVLPSGYPSDWKPIAGTTSVKPDYEMDPDVCKSATYKDLITPALQSVPTMCIVTTISNLFSNINDATSGGIYVYTGKGSLAGGGTGKEWVRPTSIEYFDPSTGSSFQANCQLKLHGGNSRDPGNSLKHGFELVFKSIYGPSKLNFDLFDQKKSAKEFNSLILRAGYNYSWTLMSPTNTGHIDQRLRAQYLQDPWTKNTQLAMNHLSGHQRFVHLYINGLYWGMYNISEDYTDDFSASYLAGSKDEFDVIKEQQYGYPGITVPTAGTFTAWADFLTQVQTNNIANNVNYQKIQGKNENGTTNSSYSNLLDPENYIDYMLLNYYLGNLDWDKNNWCAIRNRVKNQQGFQFICWDAETTMTAIGTNLVSASATSNNPTNFIKYLIKNADFKVLLADRIQKQLINTGGELTPASAAQRYEELAQEIGQAIIGESARWGDCSGTSILYTRDNQWVNRKNDLLTNYFPFRTDTVIKQLRVAGYFPTVNVPEFTHYGGNINEPIDLGMQTNAGDIYYTTDGADPRVSVSGVVSASANLYNQVLNIGSSLTVKARAKTSSEWSALTEATFVYDPTNDVNYLEQRKLLYSNYPNPFEHITTIQISLPTEGDLQIDIYCMDGRVVKNLFKGKAQAGQNQFLWLAENQLSGVYVCCIVYQGKRSYLKLIKK